MVVAAAVAAVAFSALVLMPPRLTVVTHFLVSLGAQALPAAASVEAEAVEPAPVGVEASSVRPRAVAIVTTVSRAAASESHQPNFETAVDLHRLVDAIKQASDAGREMTFE
jgi:hypothetical protein